MRNLIIHYSFKFLRLDRLVIEMLDLKSESNLLLKKIGSLTDNIEQLRKEFDEWK